MALTLDTNIGGEVSNSYCDVAFADTYWSNHFSSVKAAQWAALSANQKAQVLIQACRIIETARYTYLNTLPQYAIHYDRRTGKVHDMNLTRDPVKYYYYQKLQFPRNLDVHYLAPQTGDPSYNVGDIYIPDDVMEAQCEQALYLLNLDESAIANRMQGITLEKIGIGKQSIESTQEYAVTGSMFAPLAFELMRPFMIKGAKISRR